MPKIIKIQKGYKYNNLTVIKEANRYTRPNGTIIRMFQCSCICGNIKDINLYLLTSGKTKSCGCLKKINTVKVVKIHGMSSTRIYNCWEAMKNRCSNESHRDYKYYGGRGITYDKKWEKFENFYNDMKLGYKPNLTIDRTDNDGNYCKDNCLWKTMKQQGRNRRNNIKYKGKCLAEWCEELNLNYTTIHSRIKYYGRTYKEALGF